MMFGSTVSQVIADGALCALSLCTLVGPAVAGDSAMPASFRAAHTDIMQISEQIIDEPLFWRHSRQ